MSLYDYREWLRELVRKWWDEPLSDGDDYSSPDELVRRLIDALGYQPAPSPRTVTAEQRERALDILREEVEWEVGPKVLDEIIDALGITDPEPVAPVANRVALKKEEWERAVNAASEHRFVDHQSKFGDKCFCGWTSHEVPHAEHQIAYVIDALGWGLVIHEPVAPVADAPVAHPCADETDDEVECCEGRDPWAMCANCLNAASGGNDEPAPVVKAVEVDLDALKSLSALSSWWFEQWTSYGHDDRTISVDVNGTKATFDRDGAGNARVVIWGGGAL